MQWHSKECEAQIRFLNPQYKVVYAIRKRDLTVRIQFSITKFHKLVFKNLCDRSVGGFKIKMYRIHQYKVLDRNPTLN